MFFFLSRGLHMECARDRALGPLLSPGVLVKV